MSEIPGMIRPELQALPRIRDRMTFLYLERCQINRQNSAISVVDQNGIVLLPAAMISVLLLGPGTSITHRAIELISDAGVSVIWVGEQGVRFYAYGRSLSHKASLLTRQAEAVSNQRLHLSVARKMYQLRFPDEDVSRLSMQQLRGREGSRIRSVYRKESKKWNVDWNGRNYQPDSFTASDPINQALSAAHACLYGISHAVIVALGCSPGLGFVHIGHDCAFVYDIADLYKATVTIPAAFEVTAAKPDDLPAAVRRKVRDNLHAFHIIEQMVKDICWLLKDNDDEEELFAEILNLWDDRLGLVTNGVSYGKTVDVIS